ncbi:MAG TPA: peptidyl-tRNA hydrolase Pth2 [Candidatus Nanoarchaeia archaeon]|nr:peptidyl-tRNA hydrolase Pth2 [Candidatus Nanoarchaeia archaeon]
MIMKQAILVRQDLKLPKGKMAAQAAHASVECVFRADKKLVKAWRAEGMGKIVVKVADEKELRLYVDKAKDLGISTSIITDAGHTVVEPGTVTCAGLGPDASEKIDSVIGSLKLV